MTVDRVFLCHYTLSAPYSAEVPALALSKVPVSLSGKCRGDKEVFENVILYADHGNLLHCHFFPLVLHAVWYLKLIFEFINIKFLSTQYCIFIHGYNLLAKINEVVFMQKGVNTCVCMYLVPFSLQGCSKKKAGMNLWRLYSQSLSLRHYLCHSSQTLYHKEL